MYTKFNSKVHFTQDGAQIEKRGHFHMYMLEYQAVTQMSGEALSFGVTPPSVTQDQKAIP